MSAFSHIAQGRSRFDAARLRQRLGAALVRRRGQITRTLAGRIWLHRIAACGGVAGAVLAQACILSLIARFVIGVEAAALPDLATCLYGLAVGGGMLCLRPLAKAAITAA
jgi:hypothetical protein